MGAFNDLFGIGLEAKSLSVCQVIARVCVVFFAALVLVRFADKRFLGKMSAFDVILGFTLGSMLSRAINGSSALVPTLAGALVLVMLHRVLSIAASHSPLVGTIVKGREAILVRKGKVDDKEMRRLNLTRNDLLEAARLHGQVDTTDNIELATFERNGAISIIAGGQAPNR